MQRFILPGILAPLTIRVKCNALDLLNQFETESKQCEALTEPAVLMGCFGRDYVWDVLICLINTF